MNQDFQAFIVEQFNTLNSKIDSQSAKIDELTEENKRLNLKIETLESEVSRLTEENIELRNRVTSIEDRLALLDEQLTGIAPMVRDLLQEEMSLLLDPEYFSELRDQESIRSFRSAKFIVKNWSSDSDWGQYLSHFKNDRGIVTAFGKSLKQFYQTVTSHAPRHEKAVYQYWLEAEEIIVSNAMRLFKGMFA